MTFCNCVNKVFLFLLNFIVFAIGVAVIALASVVIHRGGQYQELFLSGILTLPIWTLLIGIAITVLGFFGCCGAMKEDKCMLYTYATIVSLLFIAEIVLGILVAIYPNEARNQLTKGMEEAFAKYGSQDDALNNAIDSMQHDLECCGVNGYRDWLTEFGGANGVPVTCCKDGDISDCDYGTSPDPNDLYTQGCFSAMVDSMKGVTVALGATAIALALVQVFCICIACGLAKRRSQYV